MVSFKETGDKKITDHSFTPYDPDSKLCAHGIGGGEACNGYEDEHAYQQTGPVETKRSVEAKAPITTHSFVPHVSGGNRCRSCGAHLIFHAQQSILPEDKITTHVFIDAGNGTCMDQKHPWEDEPCGAPAERHALLYATSTVPVEAVAGSDFELIEDAAEAFKYLTLDQRLREKAMQFAVDVSERAASGGALVAKAEKIYEFLKSDEV